MKEMKFEKWIEDYKPIGRKQDMCKIYDLAAEAFLVAEENCTGKIINHIWSLVDGENESLYIVNGRRMANNLGYVVSSEEWEDGAEIVVEG